MSRYYFTHGNVTTGWPVGVVSNSAIRDPYKYFRKFVEDAMRCVEPVCRDGPRNSDNRSQVLWGRRRDYNSRKQDGAQNLLKPSDFSSNTSSDFNSNTISNAFQGSGAR